MADVGVLFSRLGAATLSDRSQAHACAGEERIAGVSSSGWCDAMRAKMRAIEASRPCLIWVFAIISFCVISCATTSRHRFSEPAGNWQTKSGQLMYRRANTTLTGDVIVRFSKSGDFELTFSKGPGVTLLSLRQDASFAEVNGPFAKGRWSGAGGQAPQ